MVSDKQTLDAIAVILASSTLSCWSEELFKIERLIRATGRTTEQ